MVTTSTRRDLEDLKTLFLEYRAESESAELIMLKQLQVIVKLLTTISSKQSETLLKVAKFEDSRLEPQVAEYARKPPHPYFDGYPGTCVRDIAAKARERIQELQAILDDLDGALNAADNT